VNNYINGRKFGKLVGIVCIHCGSDSDSVCHNKCILSSVDCSNDNKKTSVSKQPTVRIAKNGEIHHVRPEDLHNPSPLRTKSKGAICFECGAKEPMCECWTDIEDDSDDETPSAAASHAEPPGSFLPFF
jgi:hypothetical protein